MKPLLSILLLTVSLAAPAAPVPEETEKQKVERAFGKVENPDGDCQFALTDGMLKLTMKGGKQYDYWDDVKNCPRAVREVKGEFVATVRAFAVLPETAAAAKGEQAEAGAGLIVLDEKGAAYRTGMHDFRGKQQHLMVIVPSSHGPAGLDIKNPGRGVFVRFTRKGDSLVFSVSGDGTTWTKHSTLSGFDPGESLRVGVYGFSNSKADTTVYLDKFSIETPGDGAKK